MSHIPLCIRRVAFAVAAVSSMTAAVCGEEMEFGAEQILPRIGQRGTAVNVTITGACLRDADEVVFFSPGIEATAPVSLPDRETSLQRHHLQRPVLKERIGCTFHIAADCPLGEHAFRIRTKRGVTNVATFHVSPLPVTDEEEEVLFSNDTPDLAGHVNPPVTVRGWFRTDQRNRLDVDVYTVPMRAGERLAVEVQSVRLADQHYGTTIFDTVLRILDTKGNVLAENDDNSTHIQDPMLTVNAKQDGPLFVEVRRAILVHYNLEETPYCVHITRNRQPFASYPAGGRSGERLEVSMLGDPAGPFSANVTVPSATGTFSFESERPTLMLLRSSPFGNIQERQGEQETSVPDLPVALNGIIKSDGERDRFRVRAHKGDRWRVRAYSRSLGFPLDPQIQIYRLKEGELETGRGELAPLLTADDATLAERDIFGTSFTGGRGLPDALDPSVIWEPAADSEYLLEISSAVGKGSPESVYRIEIEPAPRAMYTFLKSDVHDWHECVRTSGMAVAKGNRRTVAIHVAEGHGNAYKGPCSLVVKGLPPAVRAVVPPVASGQSVVPVQFVARDDAAPGMWPITIAVESVDKSVAVESGSHQWIPYCNLSGGQAWKTVHVEGYLMAVVDAIPVSVDIPPSAVSLAQGGEVVIPVRVNRAAGFDDPIEFQCSWLPPGVRQPAATVVPATVGAAELRLSADANAPLGTWPLSVTASYLNDTAGDRYLGAGLTVLSSGVTELVVVEPFVAIAAQPQSIRRGETKPFTWTVKHKRSFPGEAEVHILGLPKGITVAAPPPRLAGTASEITFLLSATHEALLGTVSGLTCEVVTAVDGRNVRLRTGKGILRVDPAVSAAHATTTSGGK